MNKFTYTVEEAVKAGPLGRTSIFNAIKNGSLPARKAGGRTFILVKDFEAWLESQPLVQSKAA
jgi:hypothetical protein